MFQKIFIVLVVAFMGCALAAPSKSKVHDQAHIDAILEFINNVPLAEVKYPMEYNASLQDSEGLPTTDKKEQGFVVAGQLIPFTANVRGPNKNDVINSCLFSQLAADYKYNREKQGDDWYNYYSSVMETLGWVMQNFNFESYHLSGSKFTMDKVVVDILLAIASDNEVVIAKELLAGLKSLSDSDGRLVLFEHSSYQNSAGNFMLSPVNQGPNGDVAMAIAGFQFSAKEDSTRFLWFEWDSSSTSIYKSSQIVTLDEDIYTYSRETVIQRLGVRSHTGTAVIPLAPIPSK